MKYILKLHRFDIDISKLKKKIMELDGSARITDDKEGLFVESSIPRAGFGFPEVDIAKEMVVGWKKLDYAALKEDCLKAAGSFDSYKLKINFFSKIPISARSLYKRINPYLKYEGRHFDENSGNIIQIDIKKEDNKRLYRVLRFSAKIVRAENNSIIAALESPTTTDEVRDMLRVCYIFNLPVVFLNAKKQLVEKSKKMEKGIPYEKLAILEHIPDGYKLFGFSRHAVLNEKNFVEKYKSNSKVCLVFGNEKFGLSQEMRDRLDYCFKLQDSTKPFKASQALSYVLGLILGKKL